MPTDQEIIERLDRIEQMLKDMAFANSPASLPGRLQGLVHACRND